MSDVNGGFYLGDGAYCKFSDDHGSVVLFTNKGVYSTNSVYLEPDMVRRFVEWVKEKGLTR